MKNTRHVWRTVGLFFGADCEYVGDGMATNACGSLQARLLSFLAIPFQLSQCTLANALVHSPVLVEDKRVHGTREGAEGPVHDTVTPVGGASVCNSLSTSGTTNLAQSSSNKLLGVGNGGASALDLGHGRGNQVGLHKLDMNSVGLELRTKSTAPLLQEGLAAGVSGQERSREDTAKGSHSEDETTTTLDHARCDNLSDAESTGAVDGDNVL